MVLPAVRIEREVSDPLLNHVLAHLPPDEWKLLKPHVRIVTLKAAELIFADAEPALVTYFPLTCIISMIAEMANGDECEYGCIGREGMLGLQIALGAQPLRGQALCQLEGEAVCIDGAILHDLTASGAAPELHRLLLRYAQATINVLAQSAACNALHSNLQRTARWLLLSRDRAGSDDFALTHAFLAKMLGVRRASVTEIAEQFQAAGIIEYTRGHIRVLSDAALEGQSCECYRIIRDEFMLVYDTARNGRGGAPGISPAVIASGS
jgi:CRP-like cAMP-binding protein